MAKYVIELDDEPCMRENGYNFYTCKTVPWWSISDMIINRLTPYTEPDRKTIEDAQEEAWKMASKCLWTITNSQSRVIFGMDGVYVPRDLSYQEAKARYETWEKQKDEIHVGCEVYYKELPELKIYVTDMDDNSFGGFALCRVEDVCDYGDRFSECNVYQYKPTGRMLPNIVELLKKMKEEP